MDAVRSTAPLGPGSGMRIAHVLGYLINPLLLPSLLFGLVLAHFEASTAEIRQVVFVVTVFFAAVPLAYLALLRRRGRIASIEIRNRSNRLRPLLVGVASYLAAFFLLRGMSTTAAALVAALVGLQVVNTVLVLLITLRWKISVHTIGVAGFVSVLLFVAHATGGRLQPAPLYGLALLIPLMMWARVRVGAHTRRQVLGGCLFGLVVPCVELQALLYAGYFAGL